jgi:glycerol-3-phosphate O-acyltransferase
MENGVVSCFDGGPEAVYAIGSQQHLTAAYYRNTVIHFFVNGAIAEVALVRAAEPDVVDAAATFWEETLALRDLLKFEFFFSDKEQFDDEIRRELSTHDAAWEHALASGADAARSLVERFKPYTAHLVIRPFLEAYRVVGDAIEALGAGDAGSEGEFLKRCLGMGKQYVLQKRIRNAESVSKVLFQSALKLARNRGLLETGSVDLASKRLAFARQIRRTIRRIDAIDALAAGRRAGLLP